MPIRKSDYPPDWKDLSFQVRTEAAWCCERCGAPGGQVILRDDRGGWMRVEAAFAPGSNIPEPTAGMSWRRLQFFGLTKVILTVAHLDRDTTNNERSNLAALCQRCHLNHDRAAQHVPNRRYGKYHTKNHQLKLL